MVVDSEESDYYNQLCDCCSICNGLIAHYPLIQWHIQDEIYAFHPGCAEKLVGGLTLDVSKTGGLNVDRHI